MEREMLQYLENHFASSENIDEYAKYIDVEELSHRFGEFPSYIDGASKCQLLLNKWIHNHPSPQRMYQNAYINFEFQQKPFCLKDLCVLCILNEEINYEEALIPETLKIYITTVSKPSDYYTRPMSSTYYEE
jgi:hypothetical protein